MLQDEVKKAIEVMKQGGVILYPTDTIWGIGCDATNPEAVKKVYEIKRRPDSKALICLVDSDARLSRYVRNVADVTWDLIELSTKPLTIIFNQVGGLAPNLLAEDGSVGIRVTREEFSKELCYRFQKPIVSTSANISGEPTARTFDEISDEIKNSVDYVVRYNQRCKEKHQPSSIIKIDANGQFVVIRE
ncbi:MAG: L-threonylcarbamoyladenylate synthase [Bacteroidales bacterium]|nr:L-threonylcarbamoyladenylate synthase [Bacteroidales bacterium]